MAKTTDTSINKKTVARVVIIVVCAVVAIGLVASMFTVIPAGHTGVVTTFGKVSENVLQEGAHFKAPWQTVYTINNQITKLEVDTEAFSKDLQTVATTLAVAYRVDKSKSYSIFKEVGKDYENVLVTPAANEVLKAIAARYTAEESVTNRAVISEGLIEELNGKLNAIGITVEDVNIINFDFSEAYISAIEEKQVAEQKLLKAQTEAEEKKVTAQGNADAMLIEAEAEAKANKILAESVTDKLVDYKKIEKWDGKMPYATGGTAILDMTDITGDTAEN